MDALEYYRTRALTMVRTKIGTSHHDLPWSIVRCSSRFGKISSDIERMYKEDQTVTTEMIWSDLADLAAECVTMMVDLDHARNTLPAIEQGKRTR